MSITPNYYYWVKAYLFGKKYLLKLEGRLLSTNHLGRQKLTVKYSTGTFPNGSLTASSNTFKNSSSGFWFVGDDE